MHNLLISWAFFMIQAPLDVKLLALQLLFQVLLQWSNIWDASALRTLKCSLTDCSTLLGYKFEHSSHQWNNNTKPRKNYLLKKHKAKKMVLRFYKVLLPDFIGLPLCSSIGTIHNHPQEKQNNTVLIPKWSFLHKTKATTI